MTKGEEEPTIYEVTVKSQSKPQGPQAAGIENELISSEDSFHKWVENKYELFWSGFITKSLKNNVGVDGYFMSGDYQLVAEEIFTLRIHNMNVSHKSNIEEVLEKPCLALVMLIPSNPTQRARFHEYRTYFKEKRIIGIVNHFKNKILYFFPYYDQLQELLGGIKDGPYMIGMVSEIAKKEEVVVAKPEGGVTDSSLVAAVEAAANKVEATISGEQKEAIVNELSESQAVEVIQEEMISELKGKIESDETVVVEESPSEKSPKKIIKEEDLEIEETPNPKLESPSKRREALIDIESTDQQQPDEITEFQPEIVTQLEDCDDLQ